MYSFSAKWGLPNKTQKIQRLPYELRINFMEKGTKFAIWD